MDKQFYRSQWHHNRKYHVKLEDIEQMIEMSFKDGFTMAVRNLDELLARLKDA